MTLILSWAWGASSPTSKRAYVFDGPTICKGCADTFVDSLRSRGFTVTRVKSYDQIAPALASRPALFLIPGGEDAHVRTQNWNAPAVEAIRKYVKEGGTYVGVCLGAYWAADWKGQMKKGQGAFQALDLVPAHVAAHTPLQLQDQYISIRWQNKNRLAFYQDGPEFEITPGADVQVLATYSPLTKGSKEKVAAFASRFGRGKVVVSGVHIEADKSWTEDDNGKSKLTYHSTEDLFRQFMDIATAPVPDTPLTSPKTLSTEATK